LKETAAEKQRGRAWETKLRQAASEARELRKALDEEELICKERMDALEKRQRDSEGAGLQAAIASIASIARASVSMSQSSQSSQSVRESALKLGHLGSSACSRQEKLKQELHTAEDLRFEISSQVSESCLVCSLVLYKYNYIMEINCHQVFVECFSNGLAVGMYCWSCDQEMRAELERLHRASDVEGGWGLQLTKS
jgi:hypothetical protein